MVAKVKVLFIGGEMRSGSTLLDMVLGQLPSVQSCGEIRNIWREALPQNPLCGCGTSFRECGFWSEVGKRAFGGWEASSISDVARLAKDLDRLRMIPLLLLHPRLKRLKVKVNALAESLSRLYRAIQEVSGATVVVDSSKFPSTAILLSLAHSVDLRVIHLVRDSRGVAYSWGKKIIKPDTGRLMPTYDSFTISARWTYSNSMFHLLRMRGIPVILLKYEALAQSPRSTLLDVLGHLGETQLAPHLDNVLSGDSVAINKGVHIVAGNYNKASKMLRITLDDEWKGRMPWRQKAMVTALTSPFLWRYGYFSSGQSS